jgi:hypothetical protein
MYLCVACTIASMIVCFPLDSLAISSVMNGTTTSSINLQTDRTSSSSAKGFQLDCPTKRPVSREVSAVNETF